MNENICRVCSTVDPTNCYSVNPECRVRQNEKVDLTPSKPMETSVTHPKLEWEEVEDWLAGYMRRARVPGGWIYRHDNDIPVTLDPSVSAQWGHAWQTSMVFVSDVGGES